MVPGVVLLPVFFTVSCPETLCSKTTLGQVAVKVEPSNVKLDSADIALVPVPVRTELSARVVAPVPPLLTGSVPVTSLVKSIVPEGTLYVLTYPLHFNNL